MNKKVLGLKLVCSIIVILIAIVWFSVCFISCMNEFERYTTAYSILRDTMPDTYKEIYLKEFISIISDNAFSLFIPLMAIPVGFYACIKSIVSMKKCKEPKGTKEISTTNA